MCADPLSLALLAGSVGAGLLGSTSKPPAPSMPAAPTGVARTTSPVVKVGTKEDETTKNPTVQQRGFTETRAAAPPIGGLGRSGLAL